jgi:hypothetical protein
VHQLVNKNFEISVHFSFLRNTFRITPCCHGGSPFAIKCVSGGTDKEFLNSPRRGGEYSASRPCRFNPNERVRSTHCLGGWMKTAIGKETLKKRKVLTLIGIESHFLGRHPSILTTAQNWLIFFLYNKAN